MVSLDGEGTQARRTASAHGLTMVTLTVVVLIDIGLRVFRYDDDPYTGVVILVLSLIVALLVTIGGTIGGTLAYDYGFNVETAGDSPVWHPSETDKLPGDREIALPREESSARDPSHTP